MIAATAFVTAAADDDDDSSWLEAAATMTLFPSRVRIPVCPFVWGTMQ